MCVISASAAAAITAAVTAVTAGISTAVTFTQIDASRKTAAYQAQELRKQAQKAELEAAYERQEGVEEARRQKISAILKMGDAKKSLAGGNIAMSSGLVLNLENDAEINSELDALTTQRNAERRAQIYMNKSSGLYADAALMDFNRRVKASSSYSQIGLGYLSSAEGVRSSAG